MLKATSDPEQEPRKKSVGIESQRPLVDFNPKHISRLPVREILAYICISSENLWICSHYLSSWKTDNYATLTGIRSTDITTDAAGPY